MSFTTGEHKAEMHRLSESRKARGLPSWAETIDVSAFFYDEALPFEQIRDQTAAAVKASRWYRKEAGDDVQLEDAVLGLSQAEDANEFDQYWGELYDLADYARVWIKTR